MHDVAVVGGGIMGCTTALHLARGGMKVALVERRGVCMAASGVNAGTLSMQIKRKEMMGYSMRGWELWKTSADWLGREVGFRQNGGLTLAFTDDEAELLEAKMTERRAAGAPIEFIDSKRAREIEPNLSDHPVLVTYCAMDGYAQSNEIGRAYRAALAEADVDVHEFVPVSALDQDASGFTIITAGEPVKARRLVLAGGAWLGRIARLIGVELPVGFRVNVVSVTERMAPVIRSIIGVASDPLSTKDGGAIATSPIGTLTLKQTEIGTVIIGGGWQGIASLDHDYTEVVPDNLIGNLRQAQHAIPILSRARVVRTWMGIEGHVPDLMPIVGPLPGIDDGFVIGCIHGGFTMGPFMGLLLAQQILGREPEMPLFDAARFGHAGDHREVVSRE